jgi:uncharacterized protein (DUF1697 family)
MRTAILLRAVNLGGHNRLSMPAVKKLLEDNGYTGVATYLQSGNVVVDGQVDPADIERLLGVDVMVRTHDELQRVIDANPFPEHVDEPSKLAVAFCDWATSASVHRDAYAPDEVVIKGKDIFIWYPNGLGRSKIGAAFGKKLGVKMTVRNWNTVTKLLAMTDGPAGAGGGHADSSRPTARRGPRRDARGHEAESRA